MAAATDKAAAEKAAAEKAEAERVAAEKEEAARVAAEAAAAETARLAADDSADDTVTVVMLVGITGTRNGEKWPAIGGSIALPADEAAQYIANGYARLPE